MTVFYILDGFDHSSNASSIDLNAVRLCFQAFLSGSEPKKFHVLTPVVSDVIYDKSKKKMSICYFLPSKYIIFIITVNIAEAMSDLVIIKLSHASAPATSPQEMILLCEKVAKGNLNPFFVQIV